MKINFQALFKDVMRQKLRKAKATSGQHQGVPHLRLPLPSSPSRTRRWCGKPPWRGTCGHVCASLTSRTWGWQTWPGSRRCRGTGLLVKCKMKKKELKKFNKNKWHLLSWFKIKDAELKYVAYMLHVKSGGVNSSCRPLAEKWRSL